MVKPAPRTRPRVSMARLPLRLGLPFRNPPMPLRRCCAGPRGSGVGNLRPPTSWTGYRESADPILCWRLPDANKIVAGVQRDAQ